MDRDQKVIATKTTCEKGKGSYKQAKNCLDPDWRGCHLVIQSLFQDSNTSWWGAKSRRPGACLTGVACLVGFRFVKCVLSHDPLQLWRLLQSVTEVRVKQEVKS